MLRVIIILTVAASIMTGCKKETPKKPPVADQPSAEKNAKPSDIKDVKASAETKKTPLAHQAIANLIKQSEFHQKRFKKSKQALDAERVAGAHKTLARLTGRFEYYASAEEALAEAKKASKHPNTHAETEAKLDFTLHRFNNVDERLKDLGKGIMLSSRKAFITEMQVDLAFARGDYKAAKTGYDALLKKRRSVANLMRQAAFQTQTGHADKADALFVEATDAVKIDREFNRASIELQRGLLDLEAERYQDAYEHYKTANTQYPGWYLVEEHIAEVLCLLGQCEEAETRYIDLIRRTESPELMASYADVLETLKRPEEAESFRKRADKRYDELLKRFPEALGGHGLEYFLARNPKRALALATKNAELRQDGEALTLLAEAYLVNDDKKKAESTLQRVLQTPYRKPSMHALAAQIFEATGNTSKAKAHKAKEAKLKQSLASKAAK